MKIGILVYRMSGIGGIEKVTAEKINAWIEMFGYEVVLITKRETEAPCFYEINKKCKRYNLDIPAKLSGGIVSYIKNIPKGLKLFVELRRILVLENIDVLFSTMVGIDSLVVPFVRTGIPKISEMHRSGVFNNKQGWLLKKSIVNKYSKFVLLNDSEVDYFPMKNIAVIPNFIDGSGYESKYEKRNIIISAGRIAREKQFDHLVDIWSLIAEKHADWEVHIYGSGSTEILQKKIDQRGLQESFKVFPATNEIKKKMQQASIFALVSESESFSMVLLEAMAAQLPVISYDSPHGPKNIITDGRDGIIVPLNDKVTFAEKLDLLIENADYRDYLVSNQKEKLDLFSKENVMNKMNDLVLSVIKK